MNANPILLVEDNPDDELLALDAFAANQVDNEIIVARNGVEALDYLLGTGRHAGRDPKSRPAFVLLDLKMPKVDGLELLRRIRADERTRYVPVVVLTSSNADEDRLQAYALGANSYILKPVDFDKFIDVTGRIGQYWLYLNKPPPE